MLRCGGFAHAIGIEQAKFKAGDFLTPSSPAEQTTAR
jgi:hypothetical protein